MLDRATRPDKFKVKEALYIKRTPANNRLNRDGGYKLPGCWIATTKKLGGGGKRTSVNCIEPHGHVSAGAMPIRIPAFSHLTSFLP